MPKKNKNIGKWCRVLSIDLIHADSKNAPFLGIYPFVIVDESNMFFHVQHDTSVFVVHKDNVEICK